jgi:hypothetical protein
LKRLILEPPIEKYPRAKHRHTKGVLQEPPTRAKAVRRAPLYKHLRRNSCTAAVLISSREARRIQSALLHIRWPVTGMSLAWLCVIRQYPY